MWDLKQGTSNANTSNFNFNGCYSIYDICDDFNELIGSRVIGLVVCSKVLSYFILYLVLSIKILRSLHVFTGNVFCFKDNCYTLAFGVPAILMICSISKYNRSKIRTAFSEKNLLNLHLHSDQLYLQKFWDYKCVNLRL